MSSMSTFVKEAQRDSVQRDNESKKRSVNAPEGQHRLAINFPMSVMEQMEDIMFARRMRNYKTLLISLIEEAHNKEFNDGE